MVQNWFFVIDWETTCKLINLVCDNVTSLLKSSGDIIRAIGVLLNILLLKNHDVTFLNVPIGILQRCAIHCLLEKKGGEHHYSIC